MAIRITLNDEQVADVIRQYKRREKIILAVIPTAQPYVPKSMLATNANGHTAPVEMPKHKLLRNAIYNMQKGESIRSVELELKFGVKPSVVSSTLQQLRKEGKTQMVKRGTWQVL